jgi:hypothetical protein
MNVHIASIDFDLNGYVVFDANRVDSGLYGRRANKRKTLDGGVASYDGGFSHGDQKIIYTFHVDETTSNSVKYIVENHSQVYVTTREGVYKAIPSYEPGYDTAKFSASILEKIV